MRWKNRESLSRNVGNPLKKEQVPFPPLVGEMVLGGLSAFRAYQGRGILLPPLRSTVFYRRRIQPSEFRMLALRPFCGLLYDDIQRTYVSLRGMGKNRAERHVDGHDGIYGTWPDAEHIPPSPHFYTLSSTKAP